MMRDYKYVLLLYLFFFPPVCHYCSVLYPLGICARDQPKNAALVPTSLYNNKEQVLLETVSDL